MATGRPLVGQFDRNHIRRNLSFTVNDFESLSEKLARTTTECDRLREENLRLRELLDEAKGSPKGTSLIESPETQQHSHVASPEASNPPILVETVSPELSVWEKIALFRSLFHGREDVYAVRWEGANGKSGYSPASIRDWDALRLVPKSEWKKRDKETRQLLPLTNEVVHNHLSGNITVGVYPLLSDETCWFLAVDFDQKTWRQDAGAFLDSCHEWNVPAALDRSRSGNGAHVWVFFAARTSATVARKLGAALLTRTMERRHQVGLGSYDRCFPTRTRCHTVDSGI